MSVKNASFLLQLYFRSLSKIYNMELSATTKVPRIEAWPFDDGTINFSVFFEDFDQARTAHYYLEKAGFEVSQVSEYSYSFQIRNVKAKTTFDNSKPLPDLVDLIQGSTNVIYRQTIPSIIFEGIKDLPVEAAK